MNLSLEEKIMFDVMNAIYKSGIPISFKGSMVLKACLFEAGYLEDVRHTVDIDGNWYSNSIPSNEQIIDSLNRVLEMNNINLNVNLYRMYGEGRSAGFEFRNKKSNELLFTMDIDVNKPSSATKIYEIEDIRFCGSSPIQMMADKISVISSDIVFRRIKDLVDMYYFSKTFIFDKNAVIQALYSSDRKLGDFNGFLNDRNNLKHSYDKFRFQGEVEKPSFDEVYQSVKEYIKDIL